MAEKKFIFLEGVCLWARVLEDMPKEQGSEDTICKLMMECSKEKFRALQKAGLSNQARLYDLDECFGKDEEGNLKPVPENLTHLEGKTFINVKKTVKFYSQKQDKHYDFGLPNVADMYGDPQKEKIGNGSTVKIKVELSPYTYKGRGGVRLDLIDVVVLDLVKFEGQAAPAFEGFTFKEKPQVDALESDYSESNGEIPPELM